MGWRGDGVEVCWGLGHETTKQSRNQRVSERADEKQKVITRDYLLVMEAEPQG